MIELCLKGTVSRVSGANFADFEADQKKLAKLAFNRCAA
ncbi:glutamate synthase subunit alpha [Chromobacterium violaceum]|uniref:Glutamate synthase subunit alpha n=1 Tax=Chromobacterium violaceum TaxID=536 RepID=A0A447TKE6_CHRVL|nr:glutamate synthase subunit alpha [Chromobacterium violaceum]